MKFRRPILLPTLLVLATAFTVGAAPESTVELSASSVMVPRGEPWQLYGNGLDAESPTVHLADFKDENWDAKASLQRVLSGEASPPERPPSGSQQVGILAADRHTALIAGANWADRPVLVWVEANGQVSTPLRINQPEVWTIHPPSPHAGDRVRVFGPNIGDRVGQDNLTSIFLVAPDGSIVPCEWFIGYSHEKGISPYFERSIDIPSDLAPGTYQLYLHGGGGDFGWSTPLAVEVREREILETTVIHVRDHGAVGDGATNERPALQKAIDTLAEKGGGVLHLHSGTFLLDGMLIVREGVILRGSGRGATTITIDPVRYPLKGEIPEEIYEGYARDWLPHQKHAEPLLWLRSRSGIESLKIDATPTHPSSQDAFVALIDEPGQTISRDVRIHDCELVNLSKTQRLHGQWRSPVSGILSAGEVHGLVIQQSTLQAEQTYSAMNGPVYGAYIAHNRFDGLPTSSGNIGIRGLKNSIFEHNHVLNSGRGLVLQTSRRDGTGTFHNYVGYNVFENIRGAINGCEMVLYEGGKGAWWGSPAEVSMDGFRIADGDWEPDALANTHVVISEGRGMGQMIPVIGNTADQVTLAVPWTLEPDADSQLMIVEAGAIHNLHVENQFKEGVAYNGPYGCAMRNIWAGDEYEKVSSQGFILWAISGPRQMSLNVVRDLRVYGRGSIQLLTQRDEEEGAMVKSFGNEFRSNQVYERENYPGNEYGLGARWWRNPRGKEIGPGTARFPAFGHEAGIHLSNYIGWAGNANDDEERLEKMPPATRWNLIFDNLVARSPVGVRVGRGITNTSIIDFFSADNGTPFSDSGTGTLVISPTIVEP